MRRDDMLRMCIIWIAFMAVGVAVSLLKPDLLKSDSAFTGLAYALMSWVIAIGIG